MGKTLRPTARFALRGAPIREGGGQVEEQEWPESEARRDAARRGQDARCARRRPHRSCRRS